VRLIGRAALHVLWRITWILAVTLAWIFFGYRSRGGRNTPRRGPVLICSNHQSFLDPVLVGMACYRPMHFFARRTLFRGAFGLLIRLYQAFPVGRGSADTEAMRKALELLGMGRMVLMFPEGTRTRDGRMGPIQRGIGMLAERSGAPVLPVFVHGAYHVWPRTRRLPRPFVRTLRVHVAEPMSFERRDGETKRTFHERIASEVEAAMLGMQERAFEELPLPLASPEGASDGAEAADAVEGDEEQGRSSSGGRE